MKRSLKVNTPIEVVLIVILFISQTKAFEESIFEDEDIYRQALPAQHSYTGMTAPGTKWCGPGNTSTSYDDLGTQRETDMCCRDHDYCDVILEAKSTLHGLNNTDWFPILKCSCEQKFINCLQEANTRLSNTVGRIYYSARRFCIFEGHPIVKCKHYMEGSFGKRCVRYTTDKKSPKLWQFYDMPFYTQNKTK